MSKKLATYCFIVSSQMNLCHAEVPVRLGLKNLVFGLEGSLELLLIALHGVDVVGEAEVNRAEVGVGLALAADVIKVLEDGKFLRNKVDIKLTASVKKVFNLFY